MWVCFAVKYWSVIVFYWEVSFLIMLFATSCMSIFQNKVHSESKTVSCLHSDSCSVAEILNLQPLPVSWLNVFLNLLWFGYDQWWWWWLLLYLSKNIDRCLKQVWQEGDVGGDWRAFPVYSWIWVDLDFTVITQPIGLDRSGKGHKAAVNISNLF